ncbi:membrane protease YdiL (CAAX protease family) [Streptomyces sp. V4I23]|uniref:CPBP family intramembrane glutamic endopeptidase n=1 Tax=Streptomyces sp. V4I23 TaxID=3042282 RepID=UPI00278ABEE6|nr:type II CAAX endopeptidase family protein [Streptomyces sp. V4I23]MDQ1013340.1 membrane protease YdiL (CAAX protease family) [Streptomyces sp. V4I23]
MTVVDQTDGILPGPDPAPVRELPFHRMALISGQHSWWRTLAGTGVVLVGALILGLVVLGAFGIAMAVLGELTGAESMHVWDGIGETGATLLALAVVIPAVFLAARWVQRRPAGTVSSVAGRLRWRWLGLCLALAVVPIAGLFLIDFLLGGYEGMTWVGLPSFLLGLAVICSLVPFQAAAEEYAFRGWLIQAVGAHVRSPWIAVLPQSVLFAAAHGWGTPWGFAELAVFGLVMGLVTIRTGGLEAAIALHLLTNLAAFGVSAGIVGGLDSDETAADMDWIAAAVSIPIMLLYAVVVLWMAHRRRISAVSTTSQETHAYSQTPGPHAQTSPGHQTPPPVQASSHDKASPTTGEPESDDS